MKRLVACLAVVGALSGPTSALAQDAEVMVLGIRSIEGDDEFALSLTGAIRHAAEQVRGWSVSDREVSLAQMALAHGCDEPDAACMAQISETLDTERIIYGTVRRTGAGSEYDYAVTLYMYNAEAGQIEGSLTDTIPRVRSDIDFLRDRVDGYVARLSGAEESGSLRIVGNVPSADVSIDGELVGTTDADGNFVTELPAGRRRVEVSAEGYTGFRGSVTVVPGTEAEIEVELTEGSGFVGGGEVDTGAGVNWAGLGLIGAGAAAAVGTIVVWLQAQSDNEGNDITEDQCDAVVASDPGSFAAYRCAVPENRGNVCDEVDEGLAHGASEQAFERAQEICGRATTLEVLSWVLPIAAVGLAGAGVLVFALDSDEEEQPGSGASLTISPRGSHEEAGVDAVLRF